MVSRALSGLPAVGHRVRAQPQFLQDAQGHLLVGDVVLGQQNARLAPGEPVQRLACRMAGDDGPRRRLRPGPLGQRQRQNDLQFLVPYRLGQIRRKPISWKRSGVAPHPQGGQHHHTGVGQVFVRLDGPAQGLAVHAGHLHVDNGNPEGIAARPAPDRGPGAPRGRPGPLPAACPRGQPGWSGSRGWWRCRPRSGRARRAARRAGDLSPAHRRPVCPGAR